MEPGIAPSTETLGVPSAERDGVVAANADYNTISVSLSEELDAVVIPEEEVEGEETVVEAPHSSGARTLSAELDGIQISEEEEILGAESSLKEGTQFLSVPLS